MDILFCAHWKNGKSSNSQAGWPAASGVGRLLLALTIIAGGAAALDRVSGQSRADTIVALSYAPASHGSLK